VLLSEISPLAPLHPHGPTGLEAIETLNTELQSKNKPKTPSPEKTYQKPYWNPGLKENYLLQENENLFLECNVEPRMDPNLRVEWFYNGEKLILGTHVTCTFEFGYVTLRRNDCSPFHAGVYTCHAFNHYGECFTSGTVNIQGKEGLSFGTLHPRGHEGLRAVQEVEGKRGEASGRRVGQTPSKGVPPKFFNQVSVWSTFFRVSCI